MQLRDLMILIETSWPFNAREYPILSGKDSREIHFFAVGHILHHQQKLLGELAAFYEIMEHEHSVFGRNDHPVLQELARKFFINALRFARVAGMNAEELENEIKKWAKA